MDMDYLELLEYNRRRQITQIGFVTDDLYDSVHRLIAWGNFGPWKIMDFNDTNVVDYTFMGKKPEGPFKFIMAVCMVGDMQFEFIQPVYGDTIYSAFLKKHGRSIHHIKNIFPCDEKLDKVVEEFKNKGVDVMQSGGVLPDRFFYLDTEDKLGFILELGNGLGTGDSIPASQLEYIPPKPLKKE